MSTLELCNIKQNRPWCHGMVLGGRVSIKAAEKIRYCICALLNMIFRPVFHYRAMAAAISLVTCEHGWDKGIAFAV